MNDYDKVRMAYDAEKDLNSYQAKQGLGPKSDSSTSQTSLTPPLDQVLNRGQRSSLV